MKTINLRWMYPHYRHDEFVDVTRRGMGRRCIRPSGRWRTMSVGKSTTAPTTLWTHTAGLENYALEHSRSPEDILLEREEMTTRLYLIAALAGGSGSCHSDTGPPCSRLLHCWYQAAGNLSDRGRPQQQGQRCHPPGSAEYAPLL